MSSRLLRCPARQLLSRSHVPPYAPNIRPPTRAFHASAPREDPVLDAILYLPHEMITLIHTQVPWYAAIPASAFLLRATLVTSLGRWSRSLMARYIGLQPLRQALARHKRDEIFKLGGFRTPKEAKIRTQQEVKQVVHKLDSRWNVTLKGQIAWTLLQIPIFFTMAEIIRKMCGARDGLLSLVISIFKSKVANMDGLSPVGLDTYFEPSMAYEGILWFQDLTMADPTGALPFIVSGLMFSNIYFTKNTSPSNSSTTQTAIRRTLLGVALLIGPMCQNLPAGLMLYWASSTSSVIVWNAWLYWKYPAPRDFTACKRPLQLPPAMKAQPRRI
ncbi:hypothetical protein EJ07DRAFT_166617 [Lizonia empirigonia]|nr:hypothetical protein EJ07DRAFT_166617 [Lizonia empirigonia]